MTEKQFQRRLKKIQKQGEQYKREKELMDVYADYFPQKKERKTSNIMLVISVVAILGYVVAAFWLQLITGIEVSPTVTSLWFAFWTVEIWQLARIKINKIKNSQDTIEIPLGDFVDGNGING